MDQAQPKPDGDTTTESADATKEDQVQSSASASCAPSTSRDCSRDQAESKSPAEASLQSSDNEDEDEDEIVTLADYLKNEDDMDTQVMAVIGNADRNICSYQKGYMPRQALYSCSTCSMKEDSATGEKYLAGFCLACSDHCHDGHEMVELFTKRNFRCDCGNEKFANTICKLAEKTGFNEKNQYNHNFSGVYCTCSRPYPDPADPINDIMIQCGVCEDWFHSRHVFDKVELELNLTEMVCFLCVKKYNFLVYYHEDGLLEYGDSEADDSVDKIATENETESLDSGIVTTPESSASASSECGNESIVDCKLEKAKQHYVDQYKTESIDESKIVSLRLDENWRQALCKCANCVSMYHTLGIDFITSKSDMVYVYEQIGLSLKRKSEEDGISAISADLNKLPRVQQVEIIHGFTDFKKELEKHLEPFRANNRVVRSEDIEEFVEKFKSRKRQRVAIPFNCR